MYRPQRINQFSVKPEHVNKETEPRLIKEFRPYFYDVEKEGYMEINAEDRVSIMLNKDIDREVYILFIWLDQFETKYKSSLSDPERTRCTLIQEKDIFIDVDEAVNAFHALCKSTAKIKKRFK